ncbi:MAG: dockerin type I domain-containing protein [Candidatus Pacebacteria bacterium]|nr:dockerin type I domain-containing protein [Candidatus Paceibacterota bacterium]
MKNGFTLIEVVIAIFFLTVGVGGCFALIQQVSASNSLNKSKFEAFYLAQEGVEIVRNIRDNNWLESRDDPGILWTEGIVSASGCLSLRISPCDSYGDVNFDGVVSDKDSDLVSDYISGFGSLSAEELKRADVNGDGDVNNLDLTAFENYIGCAPAYNLPICSLAGKFQRETIVIQIDSNNIDVLSRIYWQERGATHEVEVVNQLSNWK